MTGTPPVRDLYESSPMAAEYLWGHRVLVDACEEGECALNSDLWSSSVVKPSGRYTLTAQALHWITATLMFFVLPVAWVMMNMPKTAPSRSLLFELHKSIGLTIVMIVSAAGRRVRRSPRAGCFTRS